MIALDFNGPLKEITIEFPFVQLQRSKHLFFCDREIPRGMRTILQGGLADPFYHHGFGNAS